MFCCNCGVQIADNSRFCCNCAKSVVPPAVVRPEPVRPAPVRPEPVQNEKSWPEAFREGWRTFVSSPLVLVMIACFSLVQLINVVEMDSVMDSLGLLYYSTDLGMESALSELTAALETVGYLLLLPGILTAVGMWLIYVEGKAPATKYIKTTGFIIIQAVYVLNIIAMTVLMFIAMGSISDVEQRLGDYLSTDMKTTLGTAKVVVFVMVALIDVLYGFVIYLLVNMRRTAETCEPQGTGCAMGIGVLSIISGALSGISLLSSGLTLSGIASCGYAILLGVALMMFQSFMKKEALMRAIHFTSLYPSENQKE